AFLLLGCGRPVNGLGSVGQRLLRLGQRLAPLGRRLLGGFAGGCLLGGLFLGRDGFAGGCLRVGRGPLGGRARRRDGPGSRWRGRAAVEARLAGPPGGGTRVSPSPPGLKSARCAARSRVPAASCSVTAGSARAAPNVAVRSSRIPAGGASCPASWKACRARSSIRRRR